MKVPGRYWKVLAVVLISFLIYNKYGCGKNPFGNDTETYRWYEVESPTEENLYSVYFVNSNDGCGRWKTEELLFTMMVQAGSLLTVLLDSTYGTFILFHRTVVGQLGTLIQFYTTTGMSGKWFIATP